VSCIRPYTGRIGSCTGSVRKLRIVCTAVFGRVHWPCTRPCTLPFSAVYVARTRPCKGPCTRPSVTRPCTRVVWAVYTAGRPTGPCTRSQTARYGRVWSVTAYGPCTRPCRRHTARVDEHVYGCVWDVYTPCTWRVTCRLGPCTRPCRPTCHVHDCVLAVYTFSAVYTGRVHCRFWPST